MVNVRLHLVALGVGLAVGMGCSVYTPTYADCSLHCSEDGKCPMGTTCSDGFCRPAGFSGSCDCTAGVSEVCGGTKGECKAGVRICLESRIWGPCIGEVRPSTEICDGKDNDCDGMTDDDVFGAPECPLRVGVCGGAAQQCLGGVFVDTCGPTAYGPDYEALETQCDGKDNDCDGTIDALPPTQLVTAVDKWTAAAVTGGYFVLWARSAQSTIRARQFDARLMPVGMEQSLDVGGANISEFFNTVANGAVVVTGFRRTDGTEGVVRISTTSGALQELDRPANIAGSVDWTLGITNQGVARGFYERDGGLLTATWDSTTSAVTQSGRRLGLPVTTVSNLNSTEDATFVAWDGDFDPMDGGSTESVGAIESAEGNQVVSGTSKSYGLLVPTSGRVQRFSTFSSYLPFAFPLALNESGVNYCPNVLQSGSTCVSLYRVQDYMAVNSASATKVGDDMVVGWRSAGQIIIATALPSVSQLRPRDVTAPGQVAEFKLAATPGSGFLTVFYRSVAAPTVVQALLVCPP